MVRAWDDAIGSAESRQPADLDLNLSLHGEVKRCDGGVLSVSFFSPRLKEGVRFIHRHGI